jgi:SAM-dependent MidA family methyltransferase
MSSLPEPDPAARGHSERLADLIREEIRAAGGWIPFSRYMELALYAPGLGYYTAGARKFGAAGDFVTAPEMSPMFGRCVARQAAQVLAKTGGGVLELGAGSGALASHVLVELERRNALPAHYDILEVSADLRERQASRLSATAPHLLDRVRWLDRLPDTLTGLILGNEVLDALPVNIVAWRDAGIFERGVAAAGEGFVWDEREMPPGALLNAASRLAPGRDYVSEICLAARALVAGLARNLERGVLLFMDYGFGRAEYYHPQRAAGTLMCHCRHLAHDDPFAWPGLGDITAHVDFTAITEGGLSQGAQLLGYTTQAHFLVNCGITDLLAGASPEDAARYLPLAAQAQKLLSPSEMGELFKVIALGKGVEAPLLGFSRGDRSRSLFTGKAMPPA